MHVDRVSTWGTSGHSYIILVPLSTSKAALGALVGITCSLIVMAGDVLFYNSPFSQGVLKSHRH